MRALTRGAASIWTMWPAPSTISTVASGRGRVRGGDDPVLRAPDDEDGGFELRDRARLHPALRAAREHPSRERGERLRHPVEALVAEHPVHERAVDEPGIREEVLEDGLQLPARGRGDEAVDVLAVDVRSEAGRADEGDGADAAGSGRREREGERAPEGVADEMGGLHLGRVHEVEHRVREARNGGVGDRGGARAMAGKVEGDHRRLRGEGVEVEEPVVEVAAEPVNEEDRLGALPLHRVTKPPGRRLRVLVGDPFLLFVLVLVLGDHEPRDEGVDVLVAHLPLDENPEQGLHREQVALLRDQATEQAPVGRLERARDLLRLDLDDLVANRDLVPFGHQPAHHRPLLHGEAPLRHHDRRDRSRHGCVLSWRRSGVRRTRSGPRRGCRCPRGRARTAPGCAARSPSAPRP